MYAKRYMLLVFSALEARCGRHAVGICVRVTPHHAAYIMHDVLEGSKFTTP